MRGAVIAAEDEIRSNLYTYVPYLNRWIQPDTILPNPTNPQSYNRYTYAYNNPIRYNDPSGHYVPSEVCAMAQSNIPHCQSKTGSYFPTGLNSELEPTEWEDAFGIPLAKKTHDLLRGDYYIWGIEDTPEYDERGWPPPLYDSGEWNNFINKGGYQGTCLGIVCTDLYILGLKSVGIDLLGLKPEGGAEQKSRSYDLFGLFLKEGNRPKNYNFSGGTSVELGDLVFYKDPGGTPQHAAHVVGISGQRDDPSNIWVLNVSYSENAVNVMTLDSWYELNETAFTALKEEYGSSGSVVYGHPDKAGP